MTLFRTPIPVNNHSVTGKNRLVANDRLTTSQLIAVDSILLYGLLFIAGMFLCMTLVSLLEANRLITIRYTSEYFFFAVVIEIAITLMFIKL